MGFTEEEKNLLNKSNDLSVNGPIAAIETSAFEVTDKMTNKAIQELTPEEISRWLVAVESLFTNTYGNHLTEINEPADLFIEKLDVRTSQALSGIEKTSSTLGYTTLDFTLFIFIILVSAYVIIHQKILKPILNLIDETTLVAEGDLTRNISVAGNDEIASLVKTFNTMISTLSGLLRDIRSDSTSTRANSEQLKRVAQSSLVISEEQRLSVESIATSVYENSVASQKVAKNCVDAASHAESINNQTECGQKAMQLSLDSVNQLSHQLSVSVERMEQLTHSVSSMVDVISGYR
ncbi:methyl-accepting chemotaxis protein [Vibrio sp. DW001]|uniref:methyl-accepting chemotaxis protein n=1 Tax=Vibrio sp. DW001 TaxID=2912315 RepID=UPI0023B01CC9|nr:methyl-accepting chemotaxis protein [Vibrio sp. DW001]WED27572.1 methyl-accepting chemotaxis protein [Vibrio sp. DW001]